MTENTERRRMPARVGRKHRGLLPVEINERTFLAYRGGNMLHNAKVSIRNPLTPHPSPAVAPIAERHPLHTGAPAPRPGPGSAARRLYSLYTGLQSRPSVSCKRDEDGMNQ